MCLTLTTKLKVKTNKFNTNCAHCNSPSVAYGWLQVTLTKLLTIVQVEFNELS